LKSEKVATIELFDMRKAQFEARDSLQTTLMMNKANEHIIIVVMGDEQYFS
jgi:hypothetical protein